MKRGMGILTAVLTVLALLAGGIPAGAAETTAATWAFRQLDELAQDFYLTLTSAAPGSAATLTVSPRTPIVYTQAAMGVPAAIQTHIREANQSALDAVQLDRPDIFWMNGTTVSWEAFGQQISGGWRITVTIRLTPSVAPAYTAGAANVRVQLERAVAAFSVSGGTRYARLKSIHDTLAARVVYDLTAARAHEAVGPLLDGRAVCEGYAKAFKLVCEREGIPCVLVYGLGKSRAGSEAHMWNLVQMENARWYAVDLTWDDQEGTLFYDFFLSGGNTAASQGFGTGAFSASHIADGKPTSVSPLAFVYPPLEPEAYDLLNPLPPPARKAGDLDGSGDADSSDARMVLQYEVALITLDAAQLAAADVNGDSRVDSTDARMILQYEVGLITSL